MPTADYELQFSIFDAASGGIRIWGPQVFDGRTGAGFGPKIPVVRGCFNVVLGPVDTNGNPILQAFNGTNRFVEITVDNHAPIYPRQAISSAPHALRAAKAATSDDALKLAGYDWSAVLNTNDPAVGKLNGGRIAPTSVTGIQIAPETIASRHIAPQSVRSYHLALGAVGTSEIGSNVLSGDRIAPESLLAANFASNSIPGLAANSVNTSNLIDGAVTLTHLSPRVVQSGAASPGNVAISESSGPASTIDNLTVTLTTSGRPVWIRLISDGTDQSSYMGVWKQGGNACGAFSILRGTNVVCRYVLQSSNNGQSYNYTPSSAMQALDQPSPGTHTYRVVVECRVGGPSNATIYQSKLVAYEL